MTRPRAQFYAFTVRDPIPSFRLPLQEDDEEPLVDLNTILHELYFGSGSASQVYSFSASSSRRLVARTPS